MSRRRMLYSVIFMMLAMPFIISLPALTQGARGTSERHGSDTATVGPTAQAARLNNRSQAQATVGAVLFGTGGDGDLLVPAGQTVYGDEARAGLIGPAQTGQRALNIARVVSSFFPFRGQSGVWQDSGIDLSAGQWFAINVVGTGCPDWHEDQGCYRRPDGEGVADASFPAPGAPRYSIVGRIGANGGFFVGSQHQGFAPLSGRLYLAFNNNNPGGNFLTYGVTIRAQPEGFKPDDEILIIQMQGADAGRHEFGVIESISADGQVTLKAPLQNNYTPRPHLGGATLCTDANYTGRCETFQPTMDDGFLRDNYSGWSPNSTTPTATSIRIDGDYRAMLYPDSVYRAQNGFELFTQSDPFLGNNQIGNDRTWSIRARANSAAQIVRVAQYNRVQVQGRLMAHPWDGWTGGFLVFRARQEVLVSSTGAIDLTGTGFRGGLPSAELAPGSGGESFPINGSGFDLSTPNGGGGGGQGNYGGDERAAAGGGGGSYGAPGGRGQDSGNGAIGGSGGNLYGNPQLSLIFPGSGGGSGGGDHTCCEGRNGVGGSGGGALLLYVPRLDVLGTIRVDGASGLNAKAHSSGAGGGGAGGSIKIIMLSLTAAPGHVTALGGPGGTIAPGGGGRPAGGTGGAGSAGRIRVEACGAPPDPRLTDPPSNLEQRDCDPPTAFFTAPASGRVSYGATVSLRWSGNDSGAIVSGVRDYTVQQSIAGAPFTDVVSNTTETARGLVLSLPCRVFTFSVTATDNAGNTSLTPGILTITTSLQGDFTADGAIDADDLAQATSIWGARSGEPQYLASLDITADGHIDAADIMWMRRHQGDRCS